MKEGKCWCWVCKGSWAIQNLRATARADQIQFIEFLEEYDREVESRMTDDGMDLVHSRETFEALEPLLKKALKKIKAMNKCLQPEAA